MQREHLNLRDPLIGPKRRNVVNPSPRVELILSNPENRKRHSELIETGIGRLKEFWTKKERTAKIPIYVQIDPKEFNIDFLRKSFAFEVVAENEDGHIIIVSKDLEFTKLKRILKTLSEGENGQGKSASQLVGFLDEREREKTQF